MLKRSSRVDLALLLGSVLPALALAACRTDEVGAGQLIITSTPTDATQGGLVITVAPGAATYDELLANSSAHRYEPAYHVLVDGKELAWDDTYVVRPLAVSGGGAFNGGFYDAGVHHFTVVAPGGAAVLDTDGRIESAALTHLYVFGALDAREWRIVTYAFTPPSGKQHISAINMVRSGDVQIEIVSCTSATTACTPVSPAVGFRETFDVDLVGDSLSLDRASSLSADGAGYGYRQVATASLPAPPVLPLLALWPIDISLVASPDPGVRVAALVAAPIYLAPDGTALASGL